MINTIVNINMSLANAIQLQPPKARFCQKLSRNFTQWKHDEEEAKIDEEGVFNDEQGEKEEENLA